MGNLHFFNEDISFKLKKPQKLKDWINTVINKEGFTLEEVNYIFCSDKFLVKLNLDYLNHNTFTDIITFDYSEHRNISGEIYISVERVEENSLKFKSSFEDELHRVMIHGILHLLGYKDKKKQEKLLMREKEDACLSLRST